MFTPGDTVKVVYNPNGDFYIGDVIEMSQRIGGEMITIRPHDSTMLDVTSGTGSSSNGVKHHFIAFTRITRVNDISDDHDEVFPSKQQVKRRTRRTG